MFKANLSGQAYNLLLMEKTLPSSFSLIKRYLLGLHEPPHTEFGEHTNFAPLRRSSDDVGCESPPNYERGRPDEAHQGPATARPKGAKA